MGFAISFTVLGIPGPQGSKRVYRGNVVESSAKVKPWREAVKWAALRETTDQMLGIGKTFFPIAGAVSIEILFFLPRPKRAKAGAKPTTRPDLDKLTRSTLDAITESRIIRDDSQVVELLVAKHYEEETQRPGAHITIRHA